MTRFDLPSLTVWISGAAVAHPNDLREHVAQRLGITLRTAGKALRRLVESNWLVREGSLRRPTFRPGLLRQVTQRYALDGLQEDLPWARDFAPYLELPERARRIVQHCHTELLNNAIEHSGGSSVTVSLRQTPSHAQLLVSDDGDGLFARLKQDFGLADPALALFELGKGKLTSQPTRHSGRGLFFASKLADVLDLHANEAAFQRRAWEGGRWVAGRPLKRRGTSVYAAISLETRRTLESELQEHSLDGASYGFERTVVPLQLMVEATNALESRAQARRVLSRLDRFRRADVDFGGVAHLGHSFADELFRVQAATGESVEIVPINMSPAVAAMVASVRAA